MMSRRNDDNDDIPQDVDPDGEQFTDGRLDTEIEVGLDNLAKGS